MSDFLQIPGDLRQKYLPFANKSGQYTFKNGRRDGNVAIIYPFSSNLQKYILEDYGMQMAWGEEKIDYNRFLDVIPSVKIREYQPDTKLTQTLMWFSYFKKGFDAAVKDVGNVGEGNYKEVLDRFKETLGEFGDKLNELTSGSVNRLKMAINGIPDYKEYGFGLGDDRGWAVLYAPWVLYYQLMRTTTTAVYEFPFNGEESSFLDGDGSYGWQSRELTLDGIMGLGGAAKKSENGSLGGILNALGLNSIKTNIMPSFNPDSSPETNKEIEIKINLVNDSHDSAVNNFLCVHNLFGNVRWIQYGFVQASSALYDIKLPGANRYWMCTGNFTCKAKGVLRRPTSVVVGDIIRTYSNANTEPNTVDSELEKFLQGQTVSTERKAEAEKTKLEAEKVLKDEEERDKAAEDHMKQLSDATTEFDNKNWEATPEPPQPPQPPETTDNSQSGETTQPTSLRFIVSAENESNTETNNTEANNTDSTNNTDNTSDFDNSEVDNNSNNETNTTENTNGSDNADNGDTSNTGEEPSDETSGDSTEKAPENSTAADEQPQVNTVSYKSPEKAKFTPSITADDCLSLFSALTNADIKSLFPEGSELADKLIDGLGRGTSAPTGPFDQTTRNEILKTPNIQENLKAKLAAESGDAITARKNATENIKNAKRTISDSARTASLAVLEKKEGVYVLSTGETYQDGELAGKPIEATVDLRKFPFQEPLDPNSDYLRDKIKIPDAYELTLKFRPLLPDNFNNYVFGWREVGWDPFDIINGNNKVRPGMFERLAAQLAAALK